MKISFYQNKIKNKTKMKFHLLILLTINQLVFIWCDNPPIDNDVYALEQSIGKNPFKEVGLINLRVIKQNQNAAQYHSLNAEDSADNQLKQQSMNLFSTQIESNKFDSELKDQLLKESEMLSSFGSNSFYRLRLCRKQPAYNCYASSFTFVKNLIDANFNINLTLHTNANNKLNSLSIKTQSVQIRDPLNSIDSITFHLAIQSLKLALPPDTESYLEKIKQEMEQKERGAQADNQSFLSKYWIYIVPFLVIMFLMNLVNPEGGAAR